MIDNTLNNSGIDLNIFSEAQKADFKTLIEKQRRELVENKKTVPQITADPKNKYEPFPLTDIQQAQWYGRSGFFEISVAGQGYVEFDCKGMDLDRLESAFQIIIDRHPQMRMVVLPDLKQQVLNNLPPYRFKRYDLGGKSTEEVNKILEKVRKRMSHEAIPADTWPIYEVCATLWGENELRIHFSFDFLVGDVWCMRMIIDEWAKLYKDPDNARPLPEGLTYRDYVKGFEEIEKSELFGQSMEYWQSELESLPGAPQLPMIRQPGELKEIRSKNYSICLNCDEWKKLSGEIKRNNLTPSAFFAAAFSEVISLWNELPKHSLNIAVFNRLPVHENINDVLVGGFSSFLPLGVDNDQEKSFASRSAKLQEKLSSHLENRWVTGVRLMRELAKVKGVNAGDTLMPIVFSSTIADREGKSDIPDQYPGEWVYEISQTPQVWMEHHLREEGDKLSLHLDVVDALFPEGMIDDLVATYERLVRSLMDDPSAWEKQNSAHLLPEKYTDLWNKYNNTAGAVPTGLLHQGFLSSVQEKGDKVAIRSCRGNKTYFELDSISNKLAHALQNDGAKPNELVAVIAPKGWEQVASVLGILKSGAAYLPIKIDEPGERVNQILTDAKVTKVLTSADAIDGLCLPKGVKAIAVDGLEAQSQPETLPANPATEDDVAYVIYTSGSTGKPKGVIIRHSAALNTIVDINERFCVVDSDVIFAISALNFDLSVYDIFGGLAVGATVVMPASQAPEPFEWLKLVEESQVTVWNSVPALAEMLVTYAEDTGKVVSDSLRLVMMSGDWIPLYLPSMLKMIRPDMQIISLGGATEASIWSIYYPIEDISPEWKSIPYGLPLLNQTMYVLDNNLYPCPPWVSGEICIGGVGVADGYFGDAEKTAASFITHPETGKRLYRTGDLGRMNPEGYIEFLGRKDTQVKLRGFRIELGEIEAAITATDLTSYAVCQISGDSNETRKLIAFVTPKNKDQSSLADKLTAALEERLPDYMVPSVIKVLDDVPLTINGKVDRKRLAELAEGFGGPLEYVEPRSDAEIRIAEIWQDLLDIDKIGIHDDFFALGGDSRIASQLAIQIREVFEVELPLFKLFESANVATLAELVVEEVTLEAEVV